MSFLIFVFKEANREGENKDDLVMNPFEGAVGISGASNVNVWEERPSVGAVNMMATWPGNISCIF